MLGIGGGEMVALAILALLVFGPEGLPEIMKTVARTIRAFKAAANDFQTEVNSALALENQKNEVAQRRRRRNLSDAETSEPPQLPASEVSSPLSADDPAPALESSYGPDVLLTEDAPGPAPTADSASRDDAAAVGLLDEDTALEDLNSQTPPIAELATDDDEEFGPRRPMARPDRSAEAVLFLESDDSDPVSDESPLPSPAEVGP